MSEQPKSETIRQWFQRTTRRSRKAILYATIVIGIVMGISWHNMSVNTMSRIQTFNGALSVPLLAGLWTAALLILFLRPTREAAFRSQETLDSGIGALDKKIDAGLVAMDKKMESANKMLADAFANKIIPAADCWNRVGQRIEKILVDGLVEEVKGAIKDIKETASRLEKTAAEGNGEIKKFVADTGPAIDALKRIQVRLDNELGDGFVDDLKSAMQSVRELGGMPSAPKEKKSAPIPPVVAKRPAAAAPVAVELPQAYVPAVPVPPLAPILVVPPMPVPVVETIVVETTPQTVDTTPTVIDISHPVVIQKLQPPQSKEPDLDRALKVIGKKKPIPAGRPA